MTDLTTLSNEQLLELARSRNQPPQPAAPSLAEMSDEQLLRLAARRDMTQGRALVQGLTSGAMLNLNDETAGLRAAGLAGLPQDAQRAIARVPVASALAANIGGARMAAERFFPQTFGSRATEAYAPARDIERAQDKAAEEQFPATYTGANIAGSVVVPAGSLARGLKTATAFGAGTGAISGFGRGEGMEDRLQGAAIEGGIGAVAPAAFTGAFRAAGSGLGRAGLGATAGGVAGATQGNSIEERATNAALGAGIGAIAPAALLMAGRPVVNTIYGAVAPGSMAERQVRQAIMADRARGVQDVLSPEDIAAARAAGQDIVVGDLGATSTTRLGRAAANVSPDAEAALRGATTGRYEDQRGRFGEFINGLFGGNLNMTAVNDSLETAARLANRPRYDAAYRAGENAELWTPELQRIATSPDVQAAIRAVERKAANRAVTEGAQVVRNPFRFDDQGNMTWATTPDGGQIQPNLQFWDHVQRNLRGMAQAAPRGSDDARELEDLRRLLNKELDATVPEFGQARGMARQFFGAEDAGEAGQLFLRQRQGIQLTEAQKAFQGMSEPEREMFRRGFASELAHTLRTAPKGRDVVKMFDGVDRKKLELVFPPDELRQLEGFARREQIMNRLYTAVTGNSSSIRQARDIGIGVVGGGAAGAFSAGDPVTGLALGGSLGALVVGLLSRGRASVSEKVMREIGEIMSSNDPARINALLAGPTGPEILKGLRAASTAVDNMPKPPRREPTVTIPPPGPPDNTGFAKGGRVKEPKMSPIVEAIIEEMGKRMAPEGARRAAAIGGYSRGGAVMKVARALAERLVPEGGEATEGGLTAARRAAGKGEEAPRAAGTELVNEGTDVGIGGGTRGIAAAPNLRRMSAEDAAVTARLEPHIIRRPDGSYVAAPDWIRTPEDLARMRAELDQMIEEGVPYRGWYERSRDFTREIAGGDPTRERHISQGLGLFSPQASPDTNLNFQAQALNAYERGDPRALVRTGAQAARYNEARAAMESDPATRLGRVVRGEEDAVGMGHNSRFFPEEDTRIDDVPNMRLGRKTGVYAQQIDPSAPYAPTGTNDTWMARAFGYRNPDGSEGAFSGSITPSMHTFMDYETVLAVDRANRARLGGDNPLSAANIQELAWVVKGARDMAARLGIPYEEAVRRMNRTYPDYAGNYSASLPHEQVPGQMTGILPRMLENTPEGGALRRAFTDRATWRSATGNDALAQDLGLMNRYMSREPGVYRNSRGEVEYNPVDVSTVIAPNVSIGSGMRGVEPETGRTLTGMQAVRGLLDAQEGTPWSYIQAAGTDNVGRGRGQHTSLRVEGNAPLTQEQAAALAAIADRESLVMSNARYGANLLDFGDTQNRQAGQRMARVAPEIQQAIPGARVTRGRNDGDYVDLGGERRLYAAENAGRGMATQEAMRVINEMPPGALERLLDSPSARQKAAQNLQRLREFGGLGDRPDYEAMLRIVATSGLRGLREHIRRYGPAGLPAVLATLGLSEATRSGE